MEPAQDLAGPGEVDLHIAAALVLLLPACGEKVGMRGRFHKLRLAEKPPHPDSLPARGERE
jgi:hypothetical protein